MNRNSILFLLFISLAFRDTLPFDLFIPDHFPPLEYNLSKNPLDPNKIQLGRALFYDPILSADGSISCASCHSPFNAFAHSDHELSHGINDSIGTRNAPALFNLGWKKSFMWDGAINHLDMQALAPIAHAAEMGSSIEAVVERLNCSEIYRPIFEAAFGDQQISGERILKALSQFQLTLISGGSKYDLVIEGGNRFTEQEENGYTIFKQHCASCHQEPLFTNDQFANNGLPLDSTLHDLGRFAITKKEADRQLFKVPSLRNLKYSYPYMHDGRFQYLREVINHYTSDIKSSKLVSQELQDPMILDSNQKVDLIAFLMTLNDRDFIFNPSHQFPKGLLLSQKESIIDVDKK